MTFHRILHRSLSFTLAAVLTLSMLGGIDSLSQPGGAGGQAGQWAQQVPATVPRS